MSCFLQCYSVVRAAVASVPVAEAPATGAALAASLSSPELAAKPEPQAEPPAAARDSPAPVHPTLASESSSDAGVSIPCF